MVFFRWMDGWIPLLRFTLFRSWYSETLIVPMEQAHHLPTQKKSYRDKGTVRQYLTSTVL